MPQERQPQLRGYQIACKTFAPIFNIFTLLFFFLVIVWGIIVDSIGVEDQNVVTVQILTGLNMMATVLMVRNWWIWTVPLARAHRHKRQVWVSLFMLAFCVLLMITKLVLQFSMDKGKLELSSKYKVLTLLTGMVILLYVLVDLYFLATFVICRLQNQFEFELEEQPSFDLPDFIDQVPDIGLTEKRHTRI